MADRTPIEVTLSDISTTSLPNRPSGSTFEKRSSGSTWKSSEKFAFRIVFFYLLLLCAPLAGDWYEYISRINWSELNCRDMFVIATCRHADYITIPSESGKWGWLSYINLVIPFFIAVAGSFLWGYLDRERKEYNNLYYWIRTIARYRVGVGIVAWGFRKLVPGQMVWPTISILDTPFGDFQAQKLYWQSVGIVPSYEIFLGMAEFIAGFLLLFRKTTALGAALTFVVLGNIVIANHVYDGSVHVHSAYYAIIALILLWHDLPAIWNLIVKEKDVQLNQYYPEFHEKWMKVSRAGLKFFVHSVFVVLFFILQLDDFKHAPYRLPDTPGLANAAGVYEVITFKMNNQDLPFNPADSVRWQDAIFENWSTLTFKINKPSMMDQSNGGGYSRKDLERSWELAGIGGGRRYFYYEADTNLRILYLQNKNEKHRNEKMTLHYSRPDESRIILSGLNETKDSVYIELQKRHKSYPLFQGRRVQAYSKP